MAPDGKPTPAVGSMMGGMLRTAIKHPFAGLGKRQQAVFTDMVR
jgi:hypothetical protein